MPTDEPRPSWDAAISAYLREAVPTEPATPQQQPPHQDPPRRPDTGGNADPGTEIDTHPAAPGGAALAHRGGRPATRWVARSSGSEDSEALAAHRDRLAARYADSTVRRTATRVRSLVRSDDTPAELVDAIEAVQRPVATGRRLVVASATGGAGASTLAALLATVIAGWRHDQVALVAGAPDQDSLRLLLPGRPAATPHDFLTGEQRGPAAPPGTAAGRSAPAHRAGRAASAAGPRRSALHHRLAGARRGNGSAFGAADAATVSGGSSSGAAGSARDVDGSAADAARSAADTAGFAMDDTAAPAGPPTQTAGDLVVVTHPDGGPRVPVHAVAQFACRSCAVTVIDGGTAPPEQAVQEAHVVLLAVPPSVPGVRAARDAVARLGSDRLRLVVVDTGRPTGLAPSDAAALLTDLGHPVQVLPVDRHLAGGVGIDPMLLAEQTLTGAAQIAGAALDTATGRRLAPRTR